MSVPVLINNIKTFKNEENILVIGKIKTANEKYSKNGNKYIEGIIEDKTGDIKFKIFNNKTINEFNKIKNITPNIKFHSKYQPQFKSIMVENVEKANEEEIIEYIQNKQEYISIETIENELKNKKFNNNYLDYLFKEIIIENIEEIKKYPNTIYKSFNYPGGLLQRNYLLYKNVLENIKTYENLYDLNVELLTFIALIKDIPAKLTGYTVKNEELQVNEMGKYISQETLNIMAVDKLSFNFFNLLEEVLKNIKEELNNEIIKEKKLPLLESTIQLNEKKLKILKDLYKKLTKKEDIIKLTNDEIEELKLILKKNKKVDNIEDNIKIISNDTNVIIEVEHNKDLKEINISREEILKQIEDLGKQIKELLENSKHNEEELIKIENEKRNLLKQKEKEFKEYRETYMKIIHILETANYFFNETEKKFPKFPEAYVFANINFSFVNSVFFLEEYKKIKNNNQNNDSIFSNKFGKYLI